jgi:DNA-binding response OmpR family regulator
MFRRRRMAGDRAADRPVRFGGVEVRLGSHSVRRDGREVALRPKEFELLRALIERMDTVVSRSELLTMVWGYSTGVVSRTVDSHVVELRRKLEIDPARPAHILTVRKSGYLLKP